jgi:hypothetical protein
VGVRRPSQKRNRRAPLSKLRYPRCGKLRYPLPAWGEGEGGTTAQAGARDFPSRKISRPAGGARAALRGDLNRVGQRAGLDARVLGRATEGDLGRGGGGVHPLFRRPGLDPGLGFLGFHTKTRRWHRAARSRVSRRDAEKKGEAQRARRQFSPPACGRGWGVGAEPPILIIAPNGAQRRKRDRAPRLMARSQGGRTSAARRLRAPTNGSRRGGGSVRPHFLAPSGIGFLMFQFRPFILIFDLSGVANLIRNVKHKA